MAVGTERLRLTPGPCHTEDMLRHLTASLVTLWDRYDLPRGRNISFDGEGAPIVLEAASEMSNIKQAPAQSKCPLKAAALSAKAMLAAGVAA